ncbi:MAG TPA: hypothetical protein VGP32_03585 [Steroidobacteraceae bacterium]|jgi:hypothetical protein|nr:hypothetical protein [Steroidobacteraceae bacterium]
MNTLLATFYRDLTCGLAAVLITLALSMTFVQSTSVAPGTRTAAGVFVPVEPLHAWFGQPEPAVLVD